MADLEITASLAYVDDVVDEFDTSGDFWTEDEMAAAFKDILPDLRIVLDYLKNLL